MHPFTVLQLVDLCALLVCATLIVTRDPADRGNRAAAQLLYCGAFWAACQLLWNTSQSEETATLVLRVSALGWTPLGPLTARFILRVTRTPAPWLKRTLPLFYAAALATIAIEWATRWIHTDMVPTSWGWMYRFGPAYPWIMALSMTTFLWAIAVATVDYRASKLESERSQGLWIAAGIAQLILIGGFTDWTLPWLQRPFPPLATTCYALMGLVFAFSLSRFGYSILSPGTFASQITETMSEGLVLLRLDGRIRSVNAGLVRMLSRSRAQIETQRIGDILSLPLVDPPVEIDEGRGWLFGPDQQHIPVSVSTRLLRDGRGVQTGLAVTVRDLREIEALQRRLVLSARMVAVGQLAAGVAHEVNNPTAYVRSNLLLLREYWGEVASHEGKLFADGGELIDESLEGVERIASIVQQIGRFTHRDDGARERVELDGILDAAQRLARPRLHEGIRVERRSERVPPIECAPRELEQVFLNLIVNAADAIPERGTIRISTSVERGFACVDVADDGSGIAPDDLARVFDPFFTTKPVGEGTGLGLAICYEIVQRHGGEIEARSELGRGTVFSVRLPLSRT